MPETFETKTGDKKTALKFLKKAMKKHGRSGALATDKLRSYGAPGRKPGPRIDKKPALG